MNLLTFSTLYPSGERPTHGVFVETRLRQLVATGHVTSTVLAPVPWVPGMLPAIGGWRAHTRVARLETRHGLVVQHPRYLASPKVGMNGAAALLAAGALAWLRTWPEVKRNAVDVVDAHYVYPDGVAACALARALRRPLVITARGSDVTQLPNYLGPRLMIRRALRAADALIAVSSALGERLVELGADPGRVHVLRNGVDLVLFRPPTDRDEARRELGLDGPTLLSVGHLIERKGHDRVISALLRLPDRVRLLIAGTGPLERSLRELADRLGLAHRVRFMGLLPPEALPPVYGAADLLVLASSREGWANVLLEAMACGTPVVASPIPGNPEVVREAAAGMIAPANTPDGIATAVTSMLQQPPSRAATRFYAEGFGWEAVSAGQTSIFQSLLERRSAPHPAGGSARRPA